jgi:hypothetical protein
VHTNCVYIFWNTLYFDLGFNVCFSSTSVLSCGAPKSGWPSSYELSRCLYVFNGEC